MGSMRPQYRTPSHDTSETAPTIFADWGMSVAGAKRDRPRADGGFEEHCVEAGEQQEQQLRPERDVADVLVRRADEKIRPVAKFSPNPPIASGIRSPPPRPGHAS